MTQRLALVGFGEAGSTFAKAGGWTGANVWDVAEDRRALAIQSGFGSASDAANALGDADCILSLVSADQAVRAARECAPLMKPGAIWCDMNSIAPQTKKEAARAITDAGAHYVDVAILAPVNPAKLAVPLLIAGDKATEAHTILV